MNEESQWTRVTNKRKKAPPAAPGLPPEPPQSIRLAASIVKKEQFPSILASDSVKITEPCWFFNNGGCKNKDGTEKSSSECRYLHTYSDNVRRPPHLNARKPCDKFNLEGECKWNDMCKYSHRVLTQEEWDRYYPTDPFVPKPAVENIDTHIAKLESKVGMLEFKQDGMSRDLQYIGQLLQKYIRINALNHIKHVPV